MRYLKDHNKQLEQSLGELAELLPLIGLYGAKDETIQRRCTVIVEVELKALRIRMQRMEETRRELHKLHRHRRMVRIQK